MAKQISNLLLLVIVVSICACASLPKDFKRIQSFAFTDTKDTFLAKSFADEQAAHPGKSGFYMLSNGLDAFVARAALSQTAECSIDVQYYLYHDDRVGHLFSDQLIKAADRGVRVRLLVDDMGLSGRDVGGFIMDSHPNIEVRIFNPFSRDTGRASQIITQMGTITRRMHNKSFTVDNQAAIIGGRNIGNEYFDAKPDMAFADLDVIAIGPVVKDVSEAFDRYWNSELAYPVSVLAKKRMTPKKIAKKQKRFNKILQEQESSVYIKALKESDLARKLREDRITFMWGDADLVYDKPEKILHDLEDEDYLMALQLKSYLDQVRDELIVISPYFVPGKPGTSLLTQLAQAGVRVRILTNSLSSSDVGIVHAGYSKYRKELLRAGVELYELNKKLSRHERKEKNENSSTVSLHTKSFIYDRKKVFIGSLNLDPRSLIHNTEIGIVLSSEEMAGDMAQWFDQNIDNIAFRLELKKTGRRKETLLWHGVVDGEIQTLNAEPYTGFWKRFFTGCLSILPIESQL